MKSSISLEDFIRGIPKAELHVHIEGTFEPELMFKIAKRNNKRMKYKSIEEIREAYNFDNLQDFLNIYYGGNYLKKQINSWLNMDMRQMKS